MASKARSRVLTDHGQIQQWAEERGATPAAVRATGSDDDIGMIRLDFPGYSGAGSLEEVSWDEWFDKFDEGNLALIVQEQTAKGQKSNFNKLASRDSVEESSSRSSQRSGPQAATRRNARRGKKTRTQSAGRTSRSAPRTQHSGAKKSRSESRSRRRSPGRKAA